MVSRLRLFLLALSLVVATGCISDLIDVSQDDHGNGGNGQPSPTPTPTAALTFTLEVGPEGFASFISVTNVSGGVPPYRTLVNGVDVAPAPVLEHDLAPGTYQVQVRDSLGAVSIAQTAVITS